MIFDTIFEANKLREQAKYKRTNNPLAGTINLLIAEDHTLTARLLAAMLCKNSLINIVGVVFDGFGVIDNVSAGNVDVVLLDLLMPNMDGLEAMRLLSESNPAVKVVVLSGITDPDIIEKSLQLGAAGYLSKTADTDEIVDALASVQKGSSYLDKASMRSLAESNTKIKIKNTISIN